MPKGYVAHCSIFKIFCRRKIIAVKDALEISRFLLMSFCKKKPQL